MQKKSLLIGLLCLGTVVGISYAATAITTADEPTDSTEEEIPITYVNPISTTPTNDAKVLSTEGITSVWFTYAAGDAGIELAPVEALVGKTVDITKDGEPFKTIACDNRELVYVDFKYNNTIVVNTGLINEPGVYAVSIPAGLQESEGSGENGAFHNVSNAYTVSFTVIKNTPYEFSPAKGELAVGDLDVITLSYPQGCEVSVLNSEAIVKLVDKKVSGASTDLTTYKVAASGNVVTLTAETPANIKGFTDAIDVRHYELEFPAATVQIKNGEETEKNPEYTGGPWAVRNFIEGDFKFTPDITAGEPIAAEDLREFKLTYSRPLTLVNDINKADGTVNTLARASLKWTDGGSPRSVTYYISAISDDMKTITFTMAPFSTAYANDPEVMVSGDYYLEVNANIFANTLGNKNAKLTFNNIKVKDAAKSVYIKSFSPASEAVSNGSTQISISFFFKTTIKNPDGKITVKKNGEVYQEFKASETTTKNWDQGTQASFAYKFATAIPKDGYGVYTIEVEPGIFSYTNVEGNLLNEAADSKFYVVAPIDGVTTEPLNYGVDKTTELAAPFNNVTIVYPEGYKVIANVGDVISANNVQLAPQSLTNADKYYSSGTGSVSGTNAPSLKIVAVDGNKITVEIPADNANNRAVSPQQALGFKINAGMWKLEKDGVVNAAPQFQHYFLVRKLAPSTWDIDPNKIYDNSLAHEVTMVLPQSAYGFDGTYTVGEGEAAVETPYEVLLKDAEGNIVTPLTIKKWTGDDGKNKSMFITIPAGETLNGVYTIEVPAGMIKLGSSSAGVSQFFNPDPISCQITLGTAPVELDALVTDPASGVVTEITDQDNYGMGAGMITWTVSDNTLALNPEAVAKEITAKLYKLNDWGRWVEVSAIPASDEYVQFGGAIGAAEGDEVDPEVPATVPGQVMLLFAPMMNREFAAEGSYRVEVPSGFFKFGDKQVNGAVREYNLTVVPIDFTYTVSPDVNAEQISLPEIRITFTNAQSVEVVKDYCAKLSNGESELITPKTRMAFSEGNSVYWKFEDPASKPIDWKEGRYSFVIEAKSIAVDLPYYDEEGNWPETNLPLEFVIKNEALGVALIGLEAADNYTVYSLDGKLLLNRVDINRVADLENGLYIVNGKKVVIRK